MNNQQEAVNDSSGTVKNTLCNSAKKYANGHPYDAPSNHKSSDALFKFYLSIKFYEELIPNDSLKDQ